jgi:hypothetical protein
MHKTSNAGCRRATETEADLFQDDEISGLLYMKG